MADLGNFAGRVLKTDYVIPMYTVMPPVNGNQFVRMKRTTRQIVVPLTQVPTASRKLAQRQSFAPYDYYLPLRPLVNSTAVFSGTVKLNGNPLYDCIIRCYDLETGIEHGRSSIDYVTGSYSIIGLVPGRAYTLVVANRVYNSTTRVVQLGIITA